MEKERAHVALDRCVAVLREIRAVDVHGTFSEPIEKVLATASWGAAYKAEIVRPFDLTKVARRLQSPPPAPPVS